MTTITVHRKDRELTGKQLSANTLASFLVAQGIRLVGDLDVTRLMSPNLLLFLNRERALGYWQEQGWLRDSEGRLYLTRLGLDEVELRESGQALSRNGRKKPGNVTPELVASARRFIETGELDESEVDVDILSQTFEI